MREGGRRCGVFDGGGEFALSLSLLKGTAVARLSSLVEIGGETTGPCVCMHMCERVWRKKLKGGPC